MVTQVRSYDGHHYSHPFGVLSLRDVGVVRVVAVRHTTAGAGVSHDPTLAGRPADADVTLVYYQAAGPTPLPRKRTTR